MKLFFTTQLRNGTKYDEHRIVLESTSEDVDCKQDYIIVTYIDVRLLKNIDVRSL